MLDDLSFSGNWESTQDNKFDSGLDYGAHYQVTITTAPKHFRGTQHTPDAILDITRPGFFGMMASEIKTFLYSSPEQATEDLETNLESLPVSMEAEKLAAKAAAYQTIFHQKPGSLKHKIQESYEAAKEFLTAEESGNLIACVKEKCASSSVFAQRNLQI